MGLNANQKRAVEYLDGPLLVLAGPGTGKTQLLSHKVAYILENTDTNAENILCLTFTETGAKNMRERLKTIIGKDALKVNIGTYHAFGSDILAQYKNYSDEYDRRLDSAIDEVTQYKIIKEIQDDLPGSDILRGDSIKDIISVISEAKSAGLTEQHLEKIALQNMEDSEVLSQAISPLLKNVVPRAFEESYNGAYKPIYDLLEQYNDKISVVIFGTHSRPFGRAYGPKNNILRSLGDDNSPKIERLISVLAKELKPAILSAEAIHKISELTKWKSQFFEKDNRGNYRLKDRVANKKLLSVAKVMGEYNKYLAENGLYDFDDMIEEAVKVLGTDDGFRMTLQEKYQYIMLDEFQDTNPSQFAIVKALTNYECPMIMAVGDDDQAIYEFQGALSSNLTDFQAHYAAEVIPLVDNYRSTQEILDFSREIISQAPDRFADKELISHKEMPKKSQIYRNEFLSSDAEYGFVAGEIAKLVKSGVKQSEIAVISYKTKYFEPLLPYLKAYPEIKIAYEKRDNLLEDEKMHEIFTMARFIDEIANDKRPTVQILEVLSFPFFKLPITEVIKAVGQAKYAKRSMFETLAENENPAIATVMKFFANLVAKSFNEPLEIMLDYIIGTLEIDGYVSPFLSYYTEVDNNASAYNFADNNAKSYEIFSFYENLASLRGKLAKHFGEKALKLSDLVALLDDYQDADMALNATSPYKDADDAVQILSAHKAKGLEFEYVFMVSVDHTAWGKGKGNNNLLSLPKNLMQIRHTGTTDGERLRILYVALTRAKHTLYITNSLHDFKDKSPERLEYFEEYEDNGVVYSPFLPSKIVNTMYQVVSYDKKNENIKNWLKSYIPYSPDMRAMYQERVDKWRMSASALTSFVDIVYAGPEEFFKSYILQAPREPMTEALAYGNLIHKVYEDVTNKGITDEQALELFATEIEKYDLPTEVVKKLREKGAVDLATSLNAFKDILRQGKAEVDFASEKLVIDGVPVTGKIDHLICDEKKKTIEIYDFKTSGYHKDKWQSHATLFKYMMQLCFYKFLLNHSAKYSKYKVEKAHILFVVPDKDGEVYDRVYEFDEEDEKMLTDLMKAVYAEVSTLKFLEDDEIFIAPDSERGIKDIKNFIVLLLAKNKEQ